MARSPFTRSIATNGADSYTEQPISFSVDADEGLGGLIESLKMALEDATNRPVFDVSEFVRSSDG